MILLFLRFAFLFLVIFPFIIIFSLPQLILVKLGLPGWSRIPALFHSMMCFMLGIRIKVHGNLSIDAPTLIVSNHISWTDIIVIGATLPISFIAKSEVGGWPVISFLADMQKTILVNRQKRIDAGRTSNVIADRLAKGDAIMLFAEGTSGDGTYVQPFRSALIGGVFRALDQSSHPQLCVQPMAICYTRLSGMAISRTQRSKVAWIGDAALAPHFLALMRGGSIDAEIMLGTPIKVQAGDNRKQIALLAQEDVRKMLLKLNNHPE